MVRKLVILAVIVLTGAMSANAESLFMIGASHSYQGAPKSLFAGVRAMSVGDIVSIIMEENITVSDSMGYNSSRSSNTVDNFTSALKDWFGLGFLKDTNNYGGENTVTSSSGNDRNIVFGDTISAQVVQLLSNGNLMVQGKKTIVNNNERVDFIITGVVEPRWINQMGEISSTKVSNLQFAMSGRGSISRNQNEGIINRVIRYLF
jgi:flagellar L-ring protein precursor FlgH